MNLPQSNKELEFAKQSLEACRVSKSLAEYEKNWLNLLGHLEKVWKKSERECQDVRNKFQPWQGKFVKLRRKDQLLSYMKNARDADNHLAEEVVEKTPGKMEIKPDEKNKSDVHHIDKMVIKNGVITEYKGDPINIKVTSPAVKCIPVTTGGQTYQLPKKHLKRSITNPADPIALGTKAIEFYEDYLNQIEKKFKN